MYINLRTLHSITSEYLPFCVLAKVIKLLRLTSPPFLSPTNLITFAGTQNGDIRTKNTKNLELGEFWHTDYFFIFKHFFFLFSSLHSF